jgi:hypothetical protein
MARRFGSDGAPQGDAVTVFTTLTRPGGRPEVAMNGGGAFVVAWADVRPGGVTRIDTQNFDAAGERRGGVRVVDVIPKGYAPDECVPCAAIDDYGQSIVAWGRTAADVPAGGRSVVYAQRFDVAGRRLGAILMPGSSTVAHNDPGIAMDGGGAFTIAWTDTRRGAGQVCAQRYADDGRRAGSEVRASMAGENAARPSLSMDGNGQILLSWISRAPYRGNDEVHARVIDPTGRAATDAFRVDTGGLGYPSAPAAALGTAARGMVAWVGYGAEGAGPGVYAQRFQRFDHAASVSGTAWKDANGDGVFQSGERPQRRVAVRLFNEFGSAAGSVLTDGHGRYHFDVLPEAGYYLQFEGPAGTRVSSAGGDVDPETGRTAVFAIDPSRPELTLDLGFTAVTGNFTGPTRELFQTLSPILDGAE